MMMQPAFTAAVTATRSSVTTAPTAGTAARSIAAA